MDPRWVSIVVYFELSFRFVCFRFPIDYEMLLVRLGSWTFLCISFVYIHTVWPRAVVRNVVRVGRELITYTNFDFMKYQSWLPEIRRDY